MKKILILANSSMGLYKFRNEFLLRLVKQYEVVVSLPDDEFVDKITEDGCRVVHTYINRRGINPFEDIKTVSAYRKLLNTEKPDIVLTYTVKPNVYGGFLCRLKKVPYITTITGLGTGFEGNGPVQKLVKFMYRRALKKASCIIFQNENNMNVMKRFRCIPEGIETILVPGSGVNVEEHSYIEYPPDGEVHFLFIGRLLVTKGIGELLQAAKKIREKYSNAIFDIVGPYEADEKSIIEQLINEATQSGTAIFHGYRTDVDTCYGACHAYIHPSYSEGMSNVVLEAASCGRPVLTSDIPGCREAYENGVGGIAFEPQSSEAICMAVEQFMEMTYEQRAEMGKKAREYVKEHFDRNIVISAYLNEIEKWINA